jgi:hypothetical protein
MQAQPPVLLEELHKQPLRERQGLWVPYRQDALQRTLRNQLHLS